jgi:ribonuclease-3
LSSEDLARLIGHAFARPELLAEALALPGSIPQTRNSGRGRRPQQRSYERLEFLGDRVLGLVVADLLWHRFPDDPEGTLTPRYHHLVQRGTLARVAAAIGLDRHLTLSKAQAAEGATSNPAILADVCEAVIAALYLDAGYPAAADFIERWWAPLLAEIETPPIDPKTSLQEWAQGRGLALPHYELIATSGPDHAPRFTVAAHVAGFEEATATASSKRAAEAGAAAALLARLEMR